MSATERLYVRWGGDLYIVAIRPDDGFVHLIEIRSQGVPPQVASWDDLHPSAQEAISSALINRDRHT